MYNQEPIPTIFARSIAESVGLLPKNIDDVPDEANFTIKNAELRLSQFQKMAISCTVEESILAYHGVNLSENQKTALALIHKSTIPWLTGYVIGELINTKEATVKNAEFILGQLIKDGKIDQNKAKSLLVSLQVVDATKPISK